MKLWDAVTGTLLQTLKSHNGELYVVIFDPKGERLASCRAALGEAAYAEAMEQGRLMTREQAIAYALEDQE